MVNNAIFLIYIFDQSFLLYLTIFLYLEQQGQKT